MSSAQTTATSTVAATAAAGTFLTHPLLGNAADGITVGFDANLWMTIDPNIVEGNDASVTGRTTPPRRPERYVRDRERRRRVLDARRLRGGSRKPMVRSPRASSCGRMPWASHARSFRKVREARDEGERMTELLAELDRYVPGDARERTMTDALRTFLRAHDDAFERTLALGHVTGSAWIVDRAGQHALLLHHRKLDRWLQPGGHADGDRDVRRVAEREAREESGLTTIVSASDAIYDVDVHEIPVRANEPAHAHYDVRFAFFADATERPHRNHESSEVAWIPLVAIDDYAIDDSVRRLVAKTISLVRNAIA